MSYRVTLKTEGLEALREKMDPKRLLRDVAELHQRAVVMTLLNLVVLCSVDTGRARGGFLPYLEKHGVSAGAQLRRSSPLQHGGIMSLDPRAIAEGRAMGSFTEQPLNVEIRNSVSYVQYINSGTSRMVGTAFIDKTLLRLTDWYPRLIKKYVETRLMQLGVPPEPLDNNPAMGL